MHQTRLLVAWETTRPYVRGGVDGDCAQFIACRGQEFPSPVSSLQPGDGVERRLAAVQLLRLSGPAGTARGHLSAMRLRLQHRSGDRPLRARHMRNRAAAEGKRSHLSSLAGAPRRRTRRTRTRRLIRTGLFVSPARTRRVSAHPRIQSSDRPERGKLNANDGVRIDAREEPFSAAGEYARPGTDLFRFRALDSSLAGLRSGVSQPRPRSG